jgi:hypothetical protein
VATLAAGGEIEEYQRRWGQRREELSMRKMIGVASGVLAMVSVAAAGRPDSSALDGFDRTGETVNCLDLRSTDITPVDESTFLFRVGGNYYVNNTRGACHDADSNFTRIDISMFGTQLCSGEILKIVDQSSGMFKGSCSLNSFEKLTKKPPATEQ